MTDPDKYYPTEDQTFEAQERPNQYLAGHQRTTFRSDSDPDPIFVAADTVLAVASVLRLGQLEEAERREQELTVQRELAKSQRRTAIALEKIADALVSKENR